MTKIASGKFLSLHRTDDNWEFCRRNNPTGTLRDESVAITPVYQDKTGNFRVILELNRRPPLNDKGHGLNLEIPAGLSCDEDASGTQNVQTIARKELLEETGGTVQRFVGPTLQHLSSSAGLSDETGSIVTALCQENPSETIKPDKVALALVSVPLKQAFQFLRAQSEKGINISITALAGLLKSFYDLNIQPRLDSKAVPEATILWTAAELPKEERSSLQTQKYIDLANSKLATC